MTPCADCRPLLVDLRFGLLDPADAERVDAHLAGCADCREHAADAERLHDLATAAAKADFAAPAFVAPPPSARAPKLAVVAATPVTPRDLDPTPTVRSAVVGWAVAAGLVLAAGGLVAPAAFDAVGSLAVRSDLRAANADRAAAEADKVRLDGEIRAAQAKARADLAAAQAEHDALVAKWVGAEDAAAKAAAARPFNLAVRGPAAAVPGAPNDYEVLATRAGGAAVPVAVDGVVTDGSGRELFKAALPAGASGNLRLPASVWVDAPAGPLTLAVTATDPATGAAGTVKEVVNIRPPVYATFLSIDKPLYRPGETVLYRSVTLDRARFLPPAVARPLWVDVLGPSGAVVPGSAELVRTLAADPARRDDNVAPAVLGPDGKPVRGVGTGSFALPPALPGGAYTLRASDPGPNDGPPSPGSVPVAVQGFNVLAYTPDRFDKTLEFDGKSYGPGDTVQAKLTLKDQARPLAGATLNVSLTVNVAGQTAAHPLDVAPPTTGTDGTAAVRFTLPKGDVRNASLAVTASANGTVETVTRRVPVASKTLTVEFFPEGGDLVAGVPNRVYVRATTATGKPADVRGAVTANGRDVAAVATLTDADQPGANRGLGAFTLTPAAGTEYALRVDSPAGTAMPDGAFAFRLHGVPVRAPGYLLPAVKLDGVALTVPAGVVSPGEPLRVTLHAAGKSPRTVVVGAYLRGLALAHRRATLTPGRPTDVTLDLGADTAGGVVRVTVFDEPAGAALGREDLTAVAERLVFRRPGRGLTLSFAAKRENDPGDVKAFAPGERVDLHVRGVDEAGKPAPAVVLAAVTSQSVVSMADDKTERAMPTHFLLTSEVQKPEDLEHADFLLTDHPKAAQALDLLLGTQGWRRFAEQAPARFRASADVADADRLLASLGQRAALPAAWPAAAVGALDEFWPAYQELADRLDTLETGLQSGSIAEAQGRDSIAAYNRSAQAANREAVLADKLGTFDGPRTRRRAWWPAAFTAVFSLGFALVGVRRLSASTPERRWLLRGGVGLLAVGAVLALGAALVPVGLPGYDYSKAGVPESRWSNGRTPAGPAVTAGKAAPAPAPTLDKLTRSADVVARPAKYPLDAAAIFGGGGALKDWDRRGYQPRFNMDTVPGAVPAALPAPPMAASPPAVNGPGLEGQPFQATARAMNGRPTPALKAPAGSERSKSLERELVERAPAGFNFETETMAKRVRSRGPSFGRYEAVARGPELRLTQAVRDQAGPEGAGPTLRTAPPPVARPVREYAHVRQRPNDDGPRTDFAETLLWKPVVVTGKDGGAVVTFALSDAVTAYRVVLAGHTPDGRIGGATGVIEVRPAASVDVKLPPEIGSGDRVDAPVVVTNGTPAALLSVVTVSARGADVDAALRLQVPELGGARAVTPVTPGPGAAEVSVTAVLQASPGNAVRHIDSVTRTTKVVPDGFPASGAVADLLDRTVAAKLDLPPALVPGTLAARVLYYPNPLADAVGGLAGMLREPHGCFEQTSSSNYPNLLVLDYLKETNTADPDTAKRARDLLDAGYNRLVGFECPVSGTDKKRGFEWFGAADRPHDALTAYGLVQFADMARVHPVDAAMQRRTQQFLLDRRDGQGGYKQTGPDGHSFGRVPAHTHAAYLTWALAQAGKLSAAPPDLGRELAHLKRLAADPGHPAGADPYFLALAAGACLAQNDAVGARPILRQLVPRQQPDGGVSGPPEMTSVTQSGGHDLVTETTGLTALAWVAAADPEFTLPVQSAVKFLTTRRKEGGSFGGTQATVLALKALTAHARANRAPPEAGVLTVLVGGRAVGTAKFTSAAAGPVEVAVPAATLAGPSVEVTVTTTATAPRPVSVEWSARTTQPASAAGCQVKLTTALAKTALTEGEAVRLAVTVENAADRAHGMAVAVVGLPAGLTLPADLKQLKALCDRPTAGGEPVLSYFETRGREVILYWRALTPKQVIRLDLDLVATTPGQYAGPASRAYLYYDADAKFWAAPLAATVAAKAE